MSDTTPSPLRIVEKFKVCLGDESFEADYWAMQSNFPPIPVDAPSWAEADCK
jgi:hypothetical protein